MARALRILTTLATVIAAFWAYSLLAVPWLEPPAKRIDSAVAARDGADDRLRAFRGVFQPGDWELAEDTKLLESEQTKLLWSRMDDLGDGRLRLRPCTMIFVPNGALGNELEQGRQAVILQSPDGATLQFDKPLDLRRGTFGQLKGGHMPGRVTVRSGGKLPGPEDDLYVVTSKVDLDQERIRTDGQVEFRLGPNSGRGAQMQMTFAPSAKAKNGGKYGLAYGGVDAIELRQVERLRLCMNQNARPKAGKPPAASSGRPSEPATSLVPVEITCRGKFRFESRSQTARFEDQVTVLQINADGPSDQINCETLIVHFVSRKTKSQPAGARDAEAAHQKVSLTDLEPRRIEAHGQPVVVHAPSRSAEARGERLEYDVATGLLTVESQQQESFLRQGSNELHARRVEYRPGPENALGQAMASGPGWFRGSTPKRPQDFFEARWRGQLRLEPDPDQPDRQHVLSLVGGTQLRYGQIGKLAAEKVFCWIEQQTDAGAGDTMDIRPNCMLASGQVDLDSAKLSGQFEEMTVWFETDASNHGTPRLPGKSAAEPGAGGVSMLPRAAGPTDAPAAAPRPNGVAQPAEIAGDGLLRQHVHVTGRLLKARVAVVGNRADPLELMIEDRVRMEETRSAQPGEKPMTAQGDRIHVFDASQPSAAATITGNPARFEARGLALTGANINLNGGTNRVWVEGAGRLDMAVDRDLQGRAVAQPMPLTIQWQKGMEMKDANVVFEENVLANLPNQQMRCEAMDVALKEPIRLTGARSAARPEPTKFVAHGRPGHPVEAESREFEQGEQTSYQQMRLVDMAVDVVSGEIQGKGPGDVVTVRRSTPGEDGIALLGPGMPGAPAGARAAPTRRPKAAPPAEAGKSLDRLEVVFQRSLTGNLHRRVLTFHEQVRTLYGPVAAWEMPLPADDPDALGDNGASLRCDQLTTVQIPAPGGRGTVELEAAGNLVAHGRQYTARASRMTYAQAKGLVVLEGTPRTDAQLFLEDQATPTQAGRILFWPQTRHVQVNDLRSFEMQVPAPAPPPQAAAKNSRR
jgi:lipopolysaccharide export system protein LptA